ncbi:MAG TPA: SDR family oxidoreductase [Gaiellaceae bacterium]|jgi:gluconate 5-dehydrogenase
MSFDLSGRSALVTGSTRGLGLAMARALAEAGARVVVNGRSEEAATEVAASIDGAVAAAFDVTDESAVAAGVAALGAVDVLVNNAGIGLRKPILGFSLEEWKRVVDTNLTSAFLVSRAAAPGMIERGSGKIVNICSVTSELARETTAPYAAAKGGLKMLTRAMCAEWARHGIQANAIAPGYFDTDLTQALTADAAFDAWLRARVPAGRWGVPADLAGAVVFFASSASDYVNGQILYVDGGLTAVV